MAKKLRGRLKREEVDIEMEDGKVLEWEVRELTGPQRDAYMETRRENFDHDKKGEVTGIKSYLNIVTNLLQFCVYNRKTGCPVLPQEIDALPSETQQDLFTIATTVSGIKPEQSNGEASKEVNPSQSSEKVGEG